MFCLQGVEIFKTLAMFRRCGICDFVGTGVALLEDVCHWGCALTFQEPTPFPALLSFSLPTDQDLAVSSSFSACLHATMVPAIMIMN